MKDGIVIPKSKGPTCHYVMDRTAGAYEDATPRPGDISVCMKCGTPFQFDNSLNMVTLTPQELEQIRGTEAEAYRELRKVQLSIDSLNKKN